MNNFLTIRNAKLIYRNFSGKGSQYNPEGRRNFSVIIDDPDLAQSLMSDGWNVKPLKPKDENDQIAYQLPVAVFYGKYPPKIAIRNEQSTVIIHESEVSQLDWAEIEQADLTIRPRVYDAHGQTAIKAYLKTLIVMIREDELEQEFLSNLPHLNNEEDLPF